jgi:16S rRNA processing protein RimM
VVLRIEGIADVRDAEALRDAVLVLAGELDVDPPAGLRPFQVVGLRVRDAGGEDLGEVVDLLPMPAQDLLVVARAGGRELNIPCVPPIVKAVHREEGWIEVDPPEGLLDL